MSLDVGFLEVKQGYEALIEIITITKIYRANYSGPASFLSFSHFNAFSSPSYSCGYFSFYKWGNYNQQKGSHLPKVTHLVREGVWV